MVRWIIVAGLAVLGLFLAALLATPFVVARYDFGAFVAARASTMLGRTVAIGSLRVAPGRTLTLTVRDVTLQNVEDGTHQPMVRLESVSADIEWMSLFNGPLRIRAARVEGTEVFLERLGNGAGNWSFPALRSASGTAPSSNAGLPAVLDLQLLNSALTYRTSSGSALRIALDTAQILAGDEDAPLRFTARGSYNGVPVALQADGASIRALRRTGMPDGEPFATEITATSGATTVRFKGTMIDPLNVDGAKGELTLDAPTPADLAAIAGATTALDTTLRLSGAFEHQGNLWQLTEAEGRLDETSFSAPKLILVEGGRGEPDRVTAEMAFQRLDLNALLGPGQRGRRGGADLSLAVDQTPDTLIAARVSAAKLIYAGIEADDVLLDGALDSGRISVRTLAMTFEGARASANGQISAIGDQGRGRIEANVAAQGMDVQRLRNLLGIGPLPFLGRLDGEFAVVAEAQTLNAAARGARISTVVAMRGGSISRRLVEIASIDIRSLFRRSEGMSPVSCMVAVVDIRAGVGTISPLRVRSQAGTIVGSGGFDLNRRTVDLTVSSASETTSNFALDIPVRVSGALANPSVRPARWSPQGRAQLAESDNVNRVLPQLRSFARRSPCLSAR